MCFRRNLAVSRHGSVECIVNYDSFDLANIERLVERNFAKVGACVVVW